MTRSLKVLAAAVVATVAVVGLSIANAASLGVDAGSLSTATAGHPCPGTAAAESATRWYNSSYYYAVDLAVPAGCASMPVQLDMTGAGGTLTGDGMASAAGEVRVDVGWYDASRAYTFLATVDGWDLPVAWAEDLAPYIWCTVVGGTGGTCTASLVVRTGYYDVVVATTSAVPVEWEVGFNLAHPNYGGVPSRLGNSDLDGYNDGVTRWARENDDYRPPNDVTGGASCAARPQLTVRGIDSYNASHPENNFRTVVAGRNRQFSLRVGSTNPEYWDILNC